MSENELKKLEQERDALAGKIVRLALVIAAIFGVPVLVILGIRELTGVRFIHLFPFAFVASWIMVIRLYTKTDKKMRSLEARIQELKQEHNTETEL
jgi:Flp pilus assembly protein TadB